MDKRVVKAKKFLGQHFLSDHSIAESIVNALECKNSSVAIEVGPGMGVLTSYLLERDDITTYPIELDGESVEYLSRNYPQLEDRLIEGDFLKFDLNSLNAEKISIIGNFPYNISSQIYFKIIDNKDLVDESVGMIQKEVAERIVSTPGGRVGGILSILVQAYYDVEYLFTVAPDKFIPPPRVQSAVIRLKRNSVEKLDCDEKLFRIVVKTTFNLRRKTIRNSIKSIVGDITKISPELLAKRPEQLSVGEFVELTNQVTKSRE